MAAFLARRIAQGLAVVVLVATIVFFLIHAAPGDSILDAPYPTVDQAVKQVVAEE